MSWNESKRKKCLLIFLVADIVLLLAFIVTCLPFNKKTSSQSTKTALLNVNRIPDIARITLSKADGEGNVQSVVLSKVGSNFWSGRDSFTNTLWPADNQSVANLLNTCSQIVSVRTAASTVDAWTSFGLDEESAFVLGFYDGAGGRISDGCLDCKLPDPLNIVLGGSLCISTGRYWLHTSGFRIHTQTWGAFVIQQGGTFTGIHIQKGL